MMATTMPRMGAGRTRRGWGSNTPALFPERQEAKEFRTTAAKSGMYLKLRIGGVDWTITAVNPRTKTSRVMDTGSSETQVGMLTMMSTMTRLGETYGVSWQDID